MNFQLTGQQDVLSRGLELLLHSKGHQTGDGGLSILPEPHDEKTLTVSRNGSSVTIRYCQTAHFFRGVGLLLQHLDNPTFSCKETVWLDENGVMLDCSRNAVYRPAFVRKYLEVMAFSGMNTLYLYLEDTYEIPEYPYFGQMRGRYSQKDLKDIVAFAGLFGIEVVPCIQTLAHMRTFLRWPDSSRLRDTDNILLAEDLKGRGTIIACAESLLALTALINLMLIPKACAFMGFALREHDITWRTGIIFPSVTTIPFCKIQQVSIRQNPVSRLFGLYSVHIVNGAQMMADTVIPGLAREKADEVKELLIERAKYESR